MYNDDDVENNEENDEVGEENEYNSPSSEQPDNQRNSNFLKGIGKIGNEFGKAVKKIVKGIILLPLPIKIAIFVFLVGIISFLTLDVVKAGSTRTVTSSVDKTVSSMNEKLNDASVSEEDKDKTKKALDFFEKNNSYLYFTITDINNAYTNFVNEYKDSTGDVESRTYSSLSTEYGTKSIDPNKGVNINEKRSLYEHMLMTEKYNFNKIKWVAFGHAYEKEGKVISLSSGKLKLDKELGLQYPNDGKTKIETFISLASPYMQTWHIPLAFHSAFITKSGAAEASSKFTYSVIKDAYSNIEAHWYAMQTAILNTKFRDYIETVYYSKFKLNIDVSIQYRAQRKDNPVYEKGIGTINGPFKQINLRR